MLSKYLKKINYSIIYLKSYNSFSRSMFAYHLNVNDITLMQPLTLTWNKITSNIEMLSNFYNINIITS